MRQTLSVKEPVTITHRGYQLWDSPTHKTVDLLLSWWKLHGHKNRKQHLIGYYELMGEKDKAEQLKQWQQQQNVMVHQRASAPYPYQALPHQQGQGLIGYLAPPVIPSGRP
jgi:hypothetical protein